MEEKADIGRHILDWAGAPGTREGFATPTTDLAAHREKRSVS
jgi:hypothetical protein